MTTNYTYNLLNEVAFEYDTHLQRVSKTVWSGIYWKDTGKGYKTDVILQVNIENDEISKDGLTVE